MNDLFLKSSKHIVFELLYLKVWRCNAVTTTAIGATVKMDDFLQFI